VGAVGKSFAHVFILKKKIFENHFSRTTRPEKFRIICKFPDIVQNKDLKL
jgi:hypothetical protein